MKKDKTVYLGVTVPESISKKVDKRSHLKGYRSNKSRVVTEILSDFFNKNERT